MESYWSYLTYSREDLSSCESEPIQYCGAIQGCGWLLVCDPQTEQIVAASENCQALFSRSLSTLYGLRLGDLFTRQDGQPCVLKDLLDRPSLTLDGLLLKDAHAQPTLLWETCYRAGELVCLDLEPGVVVTGNEAISVLDHLKTLVEIRDHPDDQSQAHEANPVWDGAVVGDDVAATIRAMTGFDRVMVYRFESNGDGHVIAEARHEDLQSFKGLRYPASDIPPQARKIYEQTPYRMIADVSGDPVPVRAQTGLARDAIDLGRSAFRAVSPFHRQYLQNMGVAASFSVALKVHDQLWGLVACHHYHGRKQLSRYLRSGCEVAAQILSRRIQEQIVIHASGVKAQVLDLAQRVILSVASGKKTNEILTENADEFLQVTRSAGAYIRLGSEELRLGQLPAPDYVQVAIDHLDRLNDSVIWHSDDLATDLQIERESAAGGALIVRMGGVPGDVIAWFRPEVVREVRWGGDPHGKGRSADELSPRASFQLWKEQIRGKSGPWAAADIDAAQALLVTLVRGVFQKAADLSHVNSELGRLGRAKDEFIGLISHELRTPLGVIIGWIDILGDLDIQDPEIKQAMTVIDRNARLQVRLIDDLLDMSRIMSGKVRMSLRDNTSIKGIIAEVARDLAPMAVAKSIDLQVDLPVEVRSKVDPRPGGDTGQCRLRCK